MLKDSRSGGVFLAIKVALALRPQGLPLLAGPGGVALCVAFFCVPFYLARYISAPILPGELVDCFPWPPRQYTEASQLFEADPPGRREYGAGVDLAEDLTYHGSTPWCGFVFRQRALLPVCYLPPLVYRAAMLHY